MAMPVAEQRYINPQLGTLDTVLPDAALRTMPSVLVFNVGTAYAVIVRAIAGQLIDGYPSKSIVPGTSLLFVSDGIEWRTLGWSTPACKLRRTTVAASTTGILTTISFPVGERFIQYDTDNMISDLNQPSRITINTPGKYTFGLQVSCQNVAAGLRIIYIRANGTTYLGLDTKTSVGAVQPTVMNVVSSHNFVPGDYLEGQVFQDSGANLNYNANDYSIVFWAEKVSA